MSIPATWVRPTAHHIDNTFAPGEDNNETISEKRSSAFASPELSEAGLSPKKMAFSFTRNLGEKRSSDTTSFNENKVSETPTDLSDLEQQSTESLWSPSSLAEQYESCDHNAKNWKLTKKARVVMIVSLYTFVSPISASIVSPASSDIGETFSVLSHTIKALYTSIHILAWAIGPLFITPLSENQILGRKRVLEFACWLSLIFNLLCAFSRSTAQLLILRFMSGLFSATPLNVSPAVVSDMFDAKNRNLSLACVFLIPFLGAAIAPVIGGYVVVQRGWRWVFFTLALINGSIAVIGSLTFVETYAPKLLRQKMKNQTKNNFVKDNFNLDDKGPSSTSMKSLFRPVILLCTNPLVFGLGFYMAFIYGFLYLMIVTFPSVYQKSYGFTPESSGLMYLSLGIGFLLGVIFWTFALELVYNYLTKKHGKQEPEFRLPCLLVSSFIVPIGLLWYGWSAQYKLPWIMPCVGSGIFAFGLVCVFQALQAYLIDEIPSYAASAIAGASVFRFILGFSFPLFADEMYKKIGFGWGNTASAIIALILGFPFPLVCFIYGKSIRRWIDSKDPSSS